MCGANRSHSNKTTSRKFRKSVDSISGPRAEQNIAAIVTSLDLVIMIMFLVSDMSCTRCGYSGCARRGNTYSDKVTV